MSLAKRRNDDLAGAPAKRRDDLYVKLSERVPFVGGSEFSASGRNVIYGLVALGCFVLGVLHHLSASEEHKEMIGVVQQMVKAVNLNTYVLTLSDEKRQMLDLAEPKEIQELRQLRDLQRRFLTAPELK